MKKTLSMLCVVLVVGFAGTAFAGRANKVLVCHNGSEYTGDVPDADTGNQPVEYNPYLWVDAAFLINISGNGNAVTKHVDNHGDSTTYLLVDPETDESLPLVITELELSDDGSEPVVITDYQEQQSCIPIISEP